MKFQMSAILFLGGFLTQTANAGTMGTTGPATSEWKRVVTLTASDNIHKENNSETITLLPPFQNHYTVSNSSSSFDGGLFVGLEKMLHEKWAAQFGVAGYATSPHKVQGNVIQFALPDFNNLTYRYKVNNQRLMLSGKLLSLNYHSFLPYFSGEVGFASNHARGYGETPLIYEVVPMAPFGSNNETSLSYAAGLGVDYQYNPKVRMGLGYQFAELGKYALGRSPAQVTNETLGSDRQQTHQLRFQLSYLF